MGQEKPGELSRLLGFLGIRPRQSGSRRVLTTVQLPLGVLVASLGSGPCAHYYRDAAEK